MSILNRTVKIFLIGALATGFIWVTTAGRAYAEVDNSLYRAQMGKYRNLNERYEQQKLRVAQLRKKNQILEKKYDSLQKKAERIRKEMTQYKARIEKAGQNIAAYQEQFRKYEDMAAQHERKYWQTQKDYGKHQKEYGEIRNKKLKAYENTKKNMELELKLQSDISRLEEKHQNVSRQIKMVQRDMIQLKKDYDKMVEPIDGF